MIDIGEQLTINSVSYMRGVVRIELQEFRNSSKVYHIHASSGAAISLAGQLLSVAGMVLEDSDATPTN